MNSKAIAVLVLAAIAGSAAASRPFAGIADWFAQHVKATEAQFSASIAGSTPSFCHQLDCPKFKVVNHTDGYETRDYASGKWAYTEVSGLLYSASVTVGFRRLFEYISGENEGAHKIPMTAPVLTIVRPGHGPLGKSNFTVCFFIPSEFQDNPPEPTSEDVGIFTSPKALGFVSQFGGFMVDEFTLAAKVKALRADLAADGVSFEDDGSYITASYDPPLRLRNRHNEVILRAAPSDMLAVPASK